MPSYLYKKICRWLARNAFPNKFRIWCLRKAGVQIGKDVYIAEGFTLACSLGYENNLKIGNRVAIAPNVTVVLTSDPNNSKLRKLKSKYNFIEVIGKVEIKHDAWIGAGAIILPNVTIGEYAIVGAGSVVTKDTPPYTVVAGVPARPIKKISIESEGGNDENPF